MTLDQMLKKKQYDLIWQEYCGFLDLSLSEFMEIQQRLLIEQLGLYSECDLGKRIMKGNNPKSVAEFREKVPLTTYDDYADTLLIKYENALPAKPVIWIETTWEGGRHPIKTAPYTESMIKSHKRNFLACMILATSGKKGHFNLRINDRFLYGMAPLPYLTGIVPHVIKDDLTVQFLPPNDEAEKMSFGERNKAGIRLGLKHGIDLFFGLSSIIVKTGDSFASGSSGSSSRRSLKTNLKLLKALYKSKKEGRPIYPKDIWNLKGLMCAGTDSECFKRRIEEQWGMRPLEIFGGTEPTCIATETWEKNGMVFFPDVCFFEFIPMAELEKSLSDPLYTPRTLLIDQLVPGNLYELVITNLKGGAFARYRVGDIFRCLNMGTDGGLKLPQFEYYDRIPSVIDIAAFTRITETTVKSAIDISGLDLVNWFAVKEFDEQKRAYMHLYAEVGSSNQFGSMTSEMLKEHLSIYFRYVDNDYKDLQRILGIDPLKVTVFPEGTISNYVKKTGKKIRHMNPDHYDVTEIIKNVEAAKG